MGRLSNRFLHLVERILSIKIIRSEAWQFIVDCNPNVVNLGRWAKITDEDFFGIRSFIRENLGISLSQLQQDLVAQFIYLKANELDGSGISPYYVEIGANDGIYLSNTYSLEKNLGWKGILSEANQSVVPKLLVNRLNSLIDVRAVTNKSGQSLVFMMTENSEYSSLKGASVHSSQFKGSVESIVESVSLTDLLTEYSAPRTVGFLSVDTEGNEYEIIQGLDSNIHRFSFVAVEVSKNSEQIKSLMESLGYTQILEQISLWDQWWIDTKLLKDLEKREQRSSGITGLVTSLEG